MATDDRLSFYFPGPDGYYLDHYWRNGIMELSSHEPALENKRKKRPDWDAGLFCELFPEPVNGKTVKSSLCSNPPIDHIFPRIIPFRGILVNKLTLKHKPN